MKRFSSASVFVMVLSIAATGCDSGSQGPAQEAKKDTPSASVSAPSATAPPSSPAPAAAPVSTTPRKPAKETPEEARKQLEALGLPYEPKAFFDSAAKGNAAAVEHFVAAGMDPNTPGDSKWTALMFAAEKGHAAVIQALLDGGADVNAKDGEGNTALTWAANEGQVEAAKALIAGGADVNVQNKSGTTPLTRAVLYKRDAVVEVLRQAGATDPRRE